MSDPINDFWDRRWELPDPKIEKLMISAVNTEDSLISHNTRLSDLEHKVITLTATIEEILLNRRVLVLRAREIITPEQYKSLIDMLNSVDNENWLVAIETINNLEKSYGQGIYTIRTITGT